MKRAAIHLVFAMLVLGCLTSEPGQTLPAVDGGADGVSPAADGGGNGDTGGEG